VRIDSYIMPAGTALTSQAFGGVYRVDGSRITGLDIPAFRWSAADTNIQAYARFFTYADQTEPGWSTYFGEPQLAIVASGEPYGTAAGADALGTLINAALGVIDPDGDITGYALNPGGMPAKGTVTMVNAATGQVRYTPTAGATGSDQFSVIVSDAAGNKTAVPIKVELSTPGINRAPTIPSAGFAATANENLAVGAIAATLSTTDPDGSAGIDYYFKGSLVSIVGGKYVTFSADNRFRLDRDTGALILNQGTLDRESGATSFQYDIRVADLNSGVNSRSADGKVTVTVGDIDELHTMAAKALTVNYYSKALGPFIPVPDAEGRAIDVRSLMLGDPEGGAMKWSFAGATTSGPFSVDPDGMLHLIGAITSGQTYNLTLRATDALNRSVDAVLTLTVNATDGFVANPALYDPPSGGGGGGGFYYYRPWYEQIPPIVLDRDGDGIELVSFAASTARFDQDGDGTRDRTGWVGADDALLAIDLNGNGLVDDGSEISFQRFVEGAVSDLEGLAHFDTNANGKIDSGDAQFGAFRIWQDANQDGISQASELLTLTAGGITAVGLTATPTGQTPNGSGNTLYALGSYTQADGSTRALGDVFFVFQPTAPNPVDPDDNGAPPISFTAPQFDRKAKKYRIGSIGGNLAVRLRKASGLDPQAGIVPGATMLRFPNTTIGMLGTMVLDLDGNGVKLVSRKDSKASFDMNGDGSRDDTGWAGKRDGMLVVDRNGNGRIDDGSELSFLKENAAARNGFEALGAFDSNRDGRLTASDTRFAELKLWVDANGNGATDSGELQSLADHGIAEIGLARHATNASAKIGSNLQLATGSFRRDNGTTGTVGDASLAFVPGKNRSSLDLSAHANQDQLLARMIQDMSQFGARRDIDDVRNRRVNETWADIFAA
jgi:hypothetical protein